MAEYQATGTAEITVHIEAFSQEEADRKLADGEWYEWEVDSYDLGTEAQFIGGDYCTDCGTLISPDEKVDQDGMCNVCYDKAMAEDEVLGEDTDQEDD